MAVHPEIHSMAECSLARRCKGRPVAFLLTSFALTLSLATVAGAVEIPRVSVPIPRVNIPTPHVHVPVSTLQTTAARITIHTNTSIHTNTVQVHTQHIKVSTATANNSTGTKSATTSTSSASPNATSTHANSTTTSKSSTPSGNTASAKPAVILTSTPPAQKTTTAATTPPSLCAATLGCASAPSPPPPQNQTTVTVMSTNNSCVVIPSNSPNPGSGNFNGGNILEQLSQVALVIQEAGSPGPGQLADFADNAVQNLQAGNPGQTQQADNQDFVPLPAASASEPTIAIQVSPGTGAVDVPTDIPLNPSPGLPPTQDLDPNTTLAQGFLNNKNTDQNGNPNLSPSTTLGGQPPIGNDSSAGPLINNYTGNAETQAANGSNSNGAFTSHLEGSNNQTSSQETITGVVPQSSPSIFDQIGNAISNFFNQGGGGGGQNANAPIINFNRTGK